MIFTHQSSWIRDLYLIEFVASNGSEGDTGCDRERLAETDTEGRTDQELSIIMGMLTKHYLGSSY